MNENNNENGGVYNEPPRKGFNKRIIYIIVGVVIGIILIITIVNFFSNRGPDSKFQGLWVSDSRVSSDEKEYIFFDGSNVQAFDVVGDRISVALIGEYKLEEEEGESDELTFLYNKQLEDGEVMEPEVRATQFDVKIDGDTMELSDYDYYYQYGSDKDSNGSREFKKVGSNDLSREIAGYDEFMSQYDLN